VLGLSANQTFSQKAFADYLKLNFPLLSDADLKTIKSYGVQNGTVAQRSYFIIDRSGVLRYKKILQRGEGLVPNETLLEEVKKIHAQNPV
jgi:peroxiredoxin